MERDVTKQKAQEGYEKRRLEEALAGKGELFRRGKRRDGGRG